MEISQYLMSRLCRVPEVEPSSSQLVTVSGEIRIPSYGDCFKLVTHIYYWDSYFDIKKEAVNELAHCWKHYLSSFINIYRQSFASSVDRRIVWMRYIICHSEGEPRHLWDGYEYFTKGQLKGTSGTLGYLLAIIDPSKQLFCFFKNTHANWKSFADIVYKIVKLGGSNVNWLLVYVGPIIQLCYLMDCV